METIYIKRFIKTEDDLPKDEGYYFVNIGDKYDRPLDVYHWYKTNNAQGKQDWLTYVKYWLQPTTLAELIKEKLPSKAIEAYCTEKYANSLLKPEIIARRAIRDFLLDFPAINKNKAKMDNQ